MDTNKIDVRAYPIDDPKGKTLAYASVAINDLAAIKNVRVVDGKKGIFVTMPQSQDRDGVYHDIAFPLSADLRREINEKVLAEYEEQARLPAEHRGYAVQEYEPGRSIDVNVETKLFPVRNPKSDLLAYASAALDGTMVIRGIRVRNTEKGLAVAMPQANGKDDKPYDVAFPLSGDLRAKISKDVLSKYREHIAEHNTERKPGIAERLAEGKEEAARLAAAMPMRAAPAMAKSSPGLGD